MQSFEAFRSAWEEQIFADFRKEIPWKQDILGTANNWQIWSPNMSLYVTIIHYKPLKYCQCKLNYTNFLKLRVVQVRQRNHPAVGNADCGVLFVSFQLFREDGSRWIHGFASNSNGSTMIRPIISGSRDSRLVLSCFFCPRVAGSPHFAHQICWIVKLDSSGDQQWSKKHFIPLGQPLPGPSENGAPANFNGIIPKGM